MNNAAKKLLFDVLESARSIRDWCAGRSFTDYESDRQFRRAVEREFEIIGEALGRLSIDEVKENIDGEIIMTCGLTPGWHYNYFAWYESDKRSRLTAKSAGRGSIPARGIAM